MELTTKNQRNALQEKIQTELLKRGFLAPITNFQETVARSSRYLEFITEPFQTVPVLFQKIFISTFSSNLREEFVENENGKFRVLKFWMTVSARYENFGGGTNGSQIFEISGKFYGDQNNLDFNIK